MKQTKIAACALAAALLLTPALPVTAFAARVAQTPTVSAATTTSVMVTVDGLNVRKSASANSGITGSLDKGAIIKITQTKRDARGNTWGKLSSGKGWVNLRYTTAVKQDGGSSDDSGGTRSGYVVKANMDLNVRKGPGSNTSVVDGLSKNEKVTIIEEKKDSRGNTWGRIANGKGWINLKYTTRTGESETIEEDNGTAVSYQVQLTADLNVRKGVGSGTPIVTTLSKNTKVSIVREARDSRGNTWGKLADGSGWINLRYTTRNGGQQQQQQQPSGGSYNVKVNTELNVRKGPASNTSVVKNLQENTVVTIVEEQKDSRGNTWGKLADGSGWINLKYTTRTDGQQQQQQQQPSGGSYNVRVNTELNVRKGPGSKNSVVKNLQENTVVTIVEEQKDSRGNTWGKLADGSGWINLKYTTRTNQKNNDGGNQEQQGGKSVSYTVKLTAALNVRKGPGSNYSVVTTLSKNARMTIVEEQKDSRGNTWGKLSSGTGWINLKYTAKVNTGEEPEQPTQEPTQEERSRDNGRVGTSYKVKVVDGVNIRAEASSASAVTGVLDDGDIVTIVEELWLGGRAVWGKLADGRGWISLKYTTPA